MRLAVPSDGELHEPSLRFLQGCGLPVERASSRRYIAELPAVPGVLVLFQRAADITAKVEEGSADLGIVGLDRFLESRREGGAALVLVEDLGFGRCELVLAVPEAWIDVTSTADLADLAVEFWEEGRQLRVATKYPLLVERFLYARGVNYFTLVPASGTLEAAPAMGYADLIADITSSGTTLRENSLKPLADGSILASQACLIANPQRLAGDPAERRRAKAVLEHVEAHLRAQELCCISAVLQGPSEQAVADRLQGDPLFREGPRAVISPAYSPEGSGSYVVAMQVKRKQALEAVEALRLLGGADIAVTPLLYVFQADSAGYRRLLDAAEGR